MQGVALGNKLLWFESHCRHIFYVANSFERVLALAFGIKLGLFESHYWHISLYSQGTRKRARSGVKKQTTLVRVPVSAYFFYVTISFERVLVVAFGNKLRWFECHCRHVSLCSQLS